MSLSTGVVTVDLTKTVRLVNAVEYGGTIAVGASPLTYAGGGLITSFIVAGIQSTQVPIDVRIEGIAGFIYRYVPGATIALGKLMIFVEGAVSTDAPLVEHSTAAVVAGVSGDTITFRAKFRLR